MVNVLCQWMNPILLNSEILLWESLITWWHKKNYHQFQLWIFGILQLVLEHLVWILRIDDNNVVVIYFRMVRTQSGTQTKPPFIERSRGQNAQDWQDEDPLDNIFFSCSNKIIWTLAAKNCGSWRRTGTKSDGRDTPSGGGTTRKNIGTPLDRSNKGALVLCKSGTHSLNKINWYTKTIMFQIPGVRGYSIKERGLPTKSTWNWL